MINNLVTESNVFTQKKFHDRDEALHFFSNYLLEKNIVTDEFEKALLERENSYPTGLLVGDINVAIPHAKSEYVNESSIVLCTLEDKISFFRMDDPDEEVPVSILILLAINEPEEQLETLQKIIGLIQDQKTMELIYYEKDPDKIVKLINQNC